MIFEPLALEGSYLIRPEKHEDNRGFFARTFCRNEFEQRGLNPGIAQCNVSYNRRRGTLRGMHYQAAPKAEEKLVRCTSGAMYDVIIDIRPGSDTCGKWVAVLLTGKDYAMIYIPAGFAHGFQTLEDDTEVFYQMSEFYDPLYARGIRWNDPAFDLEWPLENPIMSDKDRSYEDYRP
jgi:dTDP-4-dehydrorhamnose 3,5-epimerase